MRVFKLENVREIKYFGNALQLEVLWTSELYDALTDPAKGYQFEFEDAIWLVDRWYIDVLRVETQLVVVYMTLSRIVSPEVEGNAFWDEDAETTYQIDVTKFGDAEPQVTRRRIKGSARVGGLSYVAYDAGWSPWSDQYGNPIKPDRPRKPRKPKETPIAPLQERRRKIMLDDED